MSHRLLVAVLSVLVVLLSACSFSGTAVKSSDDGPRAVPTVVVLDASESMQTSDAPGPRWTAATRAVDALVGGLPQGTDFGVVVFGSEMSAKTVTRERGCTDVRTAVPLGRADAGAVTRALAGVTPQGFTPIGTALERAAAALPPEGPSSVVLVSDGESNCAPDPCEVSKQIRAAHHEMTVSAVGFRTDAESLQCIASEGGGVFLTADNAAQLSARLAAAQNTDVTSGRLSTTSFGSVELGQSLDEIRADEPSFPAEGEADGDRVAIVWRDCTYVFDKEKRLVEIAPGEPAGSTGVTIDGVTRGTPGSKAVELYGQPVSDENDVALFIADEKAGTGYRIGYEGAKRVADGSVKSVVLCRCLPDQGDPKVEPVLGRDKFERYAVGFGVARPTSFSIASTASSSVGDVTWESWGSDQAIGRGTSQQNGPGEPQSVTWLGASDRGWCNGVWSYRSLVRASSRAEAVDGSGVVDDICKGSTDAPPPARTEPVTLSPDSLLTFGGAGGVYVGDPESKIPRTWVKKWVSDGHGLYPVGLTKYHFVEPEADYMSAREVEVDPSGMITSFSWDRSDRGVHIGSSRTDVESAYVGVPGGTCKSSAAAMTPFYIEPSTGRAIIFFFAQEKVRFIKTKQRLQDGGSCGFE